MSELRHSGDATDDGWNGWPLDTSGRARNGYWRAGFFLCGAAPPLAFFFFFFFADAPVTKGPVPESALACLWPDIQVDVGFLLLLTSVWALLRALFAAFRTWCSRWNWQSSPAEHTLLHLHAQRL